MAWVSKTPDGETIIAEEAGARVSVNTRDGDAVRWRGCAPGDRTFARLVKAAREHVAP